MIWNPSITITPYAVLTGHGDYHRLLVHFAAGPSPLPLTSQRPIGATVTADGFWSYGAIEHKTRIGFPLSRQSFATRP